MVNGEAGSSTGTLLQRDTQSSHCVGIPVNEIRCVKNFTVNERAVC